MKIKEIGIISFFLVVLLFFLFIVKVQLNKDEKVENATETEILECLNDYYLLEESIGFSGRWFEKEIDGKNLKVSVNAGSTIYFMIEGTNKFDIVFYKMENFTQPYYAYSIDGGEMVRREISENHVTLPDMGPHIVQIVVDGLDGNDNKWEQEIGLAFERIETFGGTIKGVLPKQKRILFIGDSITEGSMINCFVPLAQSNSATAAFPWKTAELLNAEPYYIGYASSGITEKGIFSTTSMMLDYFSKDRPIEEDKIPNCDLIVLFVGTNDADADKEEFKNGYEEVLLKLHERYPEVNIVCMIPFTQSQREEIIKIGNSYSWCYVVETKEWDISYSDGIHPNAEGTDVIAGNLSKYILEKKLLEEE